MVAKERAHMNWPWPPPRRGEIAGILAGMLMAIAIMAALILVFTSYLYNMPQVANWGFGPEWDCTWPGKGDPVCIKKSLAPPNNLN